jgi:hypothetical protein
LSETGFIRSDHLVLPVLKEFSMSTNMNTATVAGNADTTATDDVNTDAPVTVAVDTADVTVEIPTPTEENPSRPAVIVRSGRPSKTKSTKPKTTHKYDAVN